MTPEREERITKVLDKRQDSITVVLENVFDPHNISAVMRTCDAVGVQEIFVLNTRIPRHKKWGAKSSSSAANWLTVHQYQDAAACFDHLRQNYEKIYTTHLDSEAIGLYEMDLTRRVADHSSELGDVTKTMVERVRNIFEESRKVCEDAGELWARGRKLTGY